MHCTIAIPGADPGNSETGGRSENRTKPGLQNTIRRTDVILKKTPRQKVGCTAPSHPPLNPPLHSAKFFKMLNFWHATNSYLYTGSRRYTVHSKQRDPKGSTECTKHQLSALTSFHPNIKWWVRVQTLNMDWIWAKIIICYISWVVALLFESPLFWLVSE